MISTKFILISIFLFILVLAVYFVLKFFLGNKDSFNFINRIIRKSTKSFINTMIKFNNNNPSSSYSEKEENGRTIYTLTYNTNLVEMNDEMALIKKFNALNEMLQEVYNETGLSSISLTKENDILDRNVIIITLIQDF